MVFHVLFYVFMVFYAEARELSPALLQRAALLLPVPGRADGIEDQSHHPRNRERGSIGRAQPQQIERANLKKLQGWKSPRQNSAWGWCKNV